MSHIGRKLPKIWPKRCFFSRPVKLFRLYLQNRNSEKTVWGIKLKVLIIAFRKKKFMKIGSLNRWVGHLEWTEVTKLARRMIEILVSHNLSKSQWILINFFFPDRFGKYLSFAIPFSIKQNGWQPPSWILLKKCNIWVNMAYIKLVSKRKLNIIVGCICK